MIYVTFSAWRKIFNTNNREGFMVILGNMWKEWVSKESLIKAGKRVGIYANGLNVNNMQKDKFEQAERVIEKENIPQPSDNLSVLASPQHTRKGSALYWKIKFEMSQALIKEANEKSLKLDEIPGLLPIAKVKPKKSVENTRVTQICGSMEGKDVLKVVENLKLQKEEEILAKTKKEERKQKEKEMFYKCKDMCICSKSKCDAAGLKQCPVCNDILQSICGKAGCRKDVKRPEMIIPACNIRKSAKRKIFETDDETDETDDDTNDDETSADDTTEDKNMEPDVMEEDPELQLQESFKDALRKTWTFLRPPTTEEEIVGKWFAVASLKTNPQPVCSKGRSQIFIR